jgi:RNA polymerase sigma factor (sigma-70 family)
MMQYKPPVNCQPDQWPNDRRDLAQLSRSEREATAAWGALYERHENWVRGFAERKGRLLFVMFEPDLAYDICHEAFFKLFKSARTITAERGLCPWFRQVVIHLLFDWDRQRRTEPLPEPDRIDNSDESEGTSAGEYAGSDDPPTDIDREKMKDCMIRALRKFQQEYPDHAKAILTCTYAELSNSEMANYLGRSLGATREYLSQCRKKLKPYLKPCRGYISNTEEGSE